MGNKLKTLGEIVLAGTLLVAGFKALQGVHYLMSLNKLGEQTQLVNERADSQYQRTGRNFRDMDEYRAKRDELRTQKLLIQGYL